MAVNQDVRWVLGTAAATAYGTNGIGGTSATNTAGELTGLRVPITVASGTWAESSKTLTKTGLLAEYAFVAGDIYIAASGTGATAGVYRIASRTSANALVLTTSLGAGADSQTDMGGTIVPAPGLYVLPRVDIIGYNVSVVAAGLMQCVDGLGNVIAGLDVTLASGDPPGPYLFPAPVPWHGGNVGIKLAAGITASLFYKVVNWSS